MQPIEAIRLLLALFLAGYFARRWELLRELRSRRHSRRAGCPPGSTCREPNTCCRSSSASAPRSLFFFLQKDLGPALFLCCVFLAVYAVARGRIGMAVAGLAAARRRASMSATGCNVSATLAERVRMWQSPWDNAVAGGDQIAQAIWAMATGGRFGTGLGLGDSRYLPAGHTDLVLAAIGEELGAAGLDVVAVLFAVLAWRGFRIGAARRRNDYGFFLATALTLFLIVPVLIMAVGRARRDAADRRRDAVSELRRVGDGRELRRARHARGDPRRQAVRRPISSRSGCRSTGSARALGVCCARRWSRCCQRPGRPCRRRTS